MYTLDVKILKKTKCFFKKSTTSKKQILETKKIFYTTALLKYKI